MKNKFIKEDQYQIPKFWYSIYNGDPTEPPHQYSTTNYYDFEKIEKIILEEFKVLTQSHSRGYDDGINNIDKITYFNEKGIVINIEYVYKEEDKLKHEGYTIYYKASEKDYVFELAEKLEVAAFPKSESNELCIICNGREGLYLNRINLDTVEVDLELNYGSEWKDGHERLLNCLLKGKNKGIALLHGEPGTGKSMYIKYLIGLLSKEGKRVIYVPKNMVSNLTDPSFLNMMTDYTKSVLVIEDAEEAVRSRKKGGNIVDTLLNLSDGLMSDFLGIQIICTFNYNYTDVDEALMRKGRLLVSHKFGKISKENAQKLSEKLGFNTVITEDMLLTDVYNQDEPTIAKQENKIGF